MTLSIVSHNDGEIISRMIRATPPSILSSYSEIIIRENAKDFCNQLHTCELEYNNIRLIFNTERFGFGKNHNLNYKASSHQSEYFIVCNPDLDQLPDVHSELCNHKRVPYFLGTAIIQDTNDKIADFKRTEISWFIILLRFIVSKKFGITKNMDNCVWVPSVFKVFSRSLFEKVNGYDERIFMYYEDYDICKRTQKHAKIQILDSTVCHVARRSSRKNFKGLWTHVKSVHYVLGKKRGKKYVG